MLKVYAGAGTTVTFDTTTCYKSNDGTFILVL